MPTMTAREREELAKLLRPPTVAKIEARERAAQLLAECEAQLAKEYHIDDPIWKELTHDARRRSTSWRKSWASKSRLPVSPGSARQAYPLIGTAAG